MKTLFFLQCSLPYLGALVEISNLKKDQSTDNKYGTPEKQVEKTYAQGSLIHHLV